MIQPYAEHQLAFDRNWEDWLKGGPHDSGWTRTGDPIVVERKIAINYPDYFRVKISAVLAKNFAEVTRWHLGLISAHLRGDDIHQTFYWKEYLLPRMPEEEAEKRVEQFVHLYESFHIDACPPVWVADVIRLKLGFDFFRFDGCHRACCALARGYEYIPTLVFRNHDVLL